MGVGRPTKYRDDMPDKVRAMLSEGYSKAACAGALGISVKVFCEWQNDESKSEFREAISEGEALSQLWWEDKGRIACSDPANDLFNATTWIFNMKNRFGDDWSDTTKHEHSGPNKGPLQWDCDVNGVKPGEATDKHT